MKILFWNIGRTPTTTQHTFVDATIVSVNPDILCIAEGTPKPADCTLLVNRITAIGYTSIYEPNFHSGPIIDNKYGYKRNGLKVFKKNGVLGIKNFIFEDQKIDGRIIHCRFKFNNEKYSCFFLHNMSKLSQKLKQETFLIHLNMFIAAKRRNFKNDKFFICGDFNLQPWEDLLRQDTTIKSYFFKKEHSFYNSTNEKDSYFNPILEYMQQHTNALMLSTHHSKIYSSLFDYALFGGGMNNFDIEVLDTITGLPMLIKNYSKIKIHNDFDHLPLLVTIK